MDFILQRYSQSAAHNGSTQGVLLEKENPPLFICHVLEDEKRDQKIKGETRIPAGFYELKIRKEDTPLTLKHRDSYNKGESAPWFVYHIEVTGVKDFSGVYIHAGNKESHTEGCLLLNDTANNNQIEPGDMSRSIQAVKRFYQKVYPYLENGGKAHLEIRDEISLL